MKLIAFFTGTAGEFNKLDRDFAINLMSAAAYHRNHVSPYRVTDFK